MKCFAGFGAEKESAGHVAINRKKLMSEVGSLVITSIGKNKNYIFLFKNKTCISTLSGLRLYL